jgi:hypothetical protein
VKKDEKTKRYYFDVTNQRLRDNTAGALSGDPRIFDAARSDSNEHLIYGKGRNARCYQAKEKSAHRSEGTIIRLRGRNDRNKVFSLSAHSGQCRRPAVSVADIQNISGNCNFSVRFSHRISFRVITEGMSLCYEAESKKTMKQRLFESKDAEWIQV